MELQAPTTKQASAEKLSEPATKESSAETDETMPLTTAAINSKATPETSTPEPQLPLPPPLTTAAAPAQSPAAQGGGGFFSWLLSVVCFWVYQALGALLLYYVASILCGAPPVLNLEFGLGCVLLCTLLPWANRLMVPRAA